MLEDYLAERDKNTEMVIFDRYFTFSWQRVCHIHLLLNLRENMELMSICEGWDCNTVSVTCQPLPTSAQGPLAPSLLGEQRTASAGDAWGQRAKDNASHVLVSHPALQESQGHSAPNYPQLIIKQFCLFLFLFFFFKCFSFPSIFFPYCNIFL